MLKKIIKILSLRKKVKDYCIIPIFERDSNNTKYVKDLLNLANKVAVSTGNPKRIKFFTGDSGDGKSK